MKTLRETARLGKVAYFDDGPRPDRTYEIGDAVEARGSQGQVLNIGVIVQPTEEEATLPHEPTDQFIRWLDDEPKWTGWQDFCPRY